MSSQPTAVEELQAGDVITELDSPDGPWYTVRRYDPARRELIIDDEIPIPVLNPSAAVSRKT